MLNLPENKSREIALTAVYMALVDPCEKILDAAKVEYGIKVPELTADNEAIRSKK